MHINENAYIYELIHTIVTDWFTAYNRKSLLWINWENHQMVRWFAKKDTPTIADRSYL